MSLDDISVGGVKYQEAVKFIQDEKITTVNVGDYIRDSAKKSIAVVGGVISLDKNFVNTAFVTKGHGELVLDDKVCHPCAAPNHHLEKDQALDPIKIGGVKYEEAVKFIQDKKITTVNVGDFMRDSAKKSIVVVDGVIRLDRKPVNTAFVTTSHGELVLNDKICHPSVANGEYLTR